MRAFSIRSSLSWLGLFGLLLCLTCGPVYGQTTGSNGNGSIYSRFGLGTLSDFSSSQSDAMGGGGYALRSLNYNPMGNPALWSDQVFTRLAAGATFQHLMASGADAQSSKLSSGRIEALQFSFPLYKQKLGVGLSFQPYTRYNYRTRNTGSVDVEAARPDSSGVQVGDVPTDYVVNFRGSGGLHSIRAGLGYEISEILRIGASLDLLFGILGNERSTQFAGGVLRSVDVSDETRLFGVSGSVGGHLSLTDVFMDDDALSLGASVKLPNSLSGTRVLELSKGRPLAPDTLNSFKGSVSLPLRSRFGVAYQPSNRWTFTADGLYEPWSSLTTTFTQETSFSQTFPVGGRETLTNRWRASVGSELVPAGTDQLSGYFANVGYRLGMYVERMYVRPAEDANLRTYALTGGVSLPTSLPGTRVDLNLQGGTRGPTNSDLVNDTFYSVSLHINFGERWFKERKLQ